MRRSYRIAGTVAATLAAAAAGVAATSGSATAAVVAKSKYQAAMKAAAAQNVHYVSTATEQGISLEVVGDTGTTSGSQLLEVQKGSITEELSVVLIGKTGYVRGNVSALENVLGLTAPQSSTYQNRWLSFPTSTGSLSELVSGLLDSDVAPELEMTGPYTFGGTKVIGGHLTQAIKGTAASSSGTKVPIVLYVESSGTPRPVQEVTNPNAKGSAIRGTVTFSNWGEVTHPVAPATSVPLVPLLPAG
ncbi:MAG: hypothetical protein ABSH29_13315 [Acidimicrobiales bacterium]|jgi:hypothetical protein